MNAFDTTSPFRRKLTPHPTLFLKLLTSIHCSILDHNIIKKKLTSKKLTTFSHFANYPEINAVKITTIMLRSGHTNIELGRLYLAGDKLYYWSPHNGYGLDFGTGGVNESYGPHGRYLGFSLRCIQE